MYSTTYVAVIVNILVAVLPKIGINIGSSELETTIQTIVALVTGFWILIQRKKLGGVTALGFKK